MSSCAPSKFSVKEEYVEEQVWSKKKDGIVKNSEASLSIQWEKT